MSREIGIGRLFEYIISTLLFLCNTAFSFIWVHYHRGAFRKRSHSLQQPENRFDKTWSRGRLFYYHCHHIIIITIAVLSGVVGSDSLIIFFVCVSVDFSVCACYIRVFSFFLLGCDEDSAIVQSYRNISSPWCIINYFSYLYLLFIVVGLTEWIIRNHIHIPRLNYWKHITDSYQKNGNST